MTFISKNDNFMGQVATVARGLATGWMDEVQSQAALGWIHFLTPLRPD